MAQRKPTVISKLQAKTKDKSLKDFISSLYAETPEHELAALSHDHLLSAAQSTFKNFKVRKKNSSNVDIFLASNDADIAVLQVSCQDTSFLIDSITNELKQQQCEIHLIVHPILFVQRNNSGNFQEFSKDGTRESLMQFHIASLYDEQGYIKLKERIINILEAVSYTITDWRKMTTRMLESVKLIKNTAALQNYKLKDESGAFLEWLIDNHMVFLGAIEYKVAGNKLIPIEPSRLGVTKSKLYSIASLPLEPQYSNIEPLIIRKWDERSVVHRTAHMDWITVKKLDSKGNLTGAHMFFGLFTSSVYYQSVRNIPLVRKKIESVIQKYGYSEHSHNCKELLTALESFPRGELLKMSFDELYETSTAIISLSLIPRIKIFIRKGQNEKFLSCIVFIPEKKFSSEARNIIDQIICGHLKGAISKRYVQVSDSGLVRMQLILKTEPDSIKKVDIKKLEQEITKAISIWSDELFSALQLKFPKKEVVGIYNRYKDAFDIKYKSIFHGSKAIHDIKLIEEALAFNWVRFDIYISRSGSGGKDVAQLKIYSPHKELALSKTLPAIENMGLFALDVFTYKVTINNQAKETAYIHHFRLQTSLKVVDKYDELRSKLQVAFEKVWLQDIDDDRYNSLIITANLSWREVVVARAISKYLKQTDFPYSYELTLEILIEHASITQKLIELFNLKFNITQKRDPKRVERIIAEIKEYIRNVKTVTEDKVLNGYLSVITAMLRTNFFQLDQYGQHKNYVSFKFSSQDIPSLPKPRPFAEIFVYSTRFEAIHLRGGKVARGGLRWSDRKEDFRTEVLGLMKAQMTKNSVIVPVGSKGGFVLKKVSPADGRDAFMNEGIECYKTFLSGLLDITDNIVNNKIITPNNVVRYDNDDPYLVVAADKGTATFSDFANSVSAQYKFWLDDAFASGGSAGYDHKKMGITAKGGWISVQRHFEEMGVDIEKQTFTCTGIGDMAGDVFGNGMLLSNNMKLVAAFNHAHIFLDPDPDPKASYKERNRLFKKARSMWSDYNPMLISKGGGVFDRKAKTIPISNEVKAILGIEESELSPENLIRAILLAPVDLLWNGGIGTYVKSVMESNEKIGDKSNDALRVNGIELRCKIIGEGGNLGMTQLGRIEYAKNGGRLNTDFIDNSAGVDCSDHEVNLKIATSDMLLNGKIKRKDRDALLTHMTDDVSKLVLLDNYKQTQIVSLETQGRDKTNAHTWLIKYLENKGLLDRKIEYLPSPEDLSKILSERKRLTRPEVAVVLAYAKNSAFSMLTAHDLTNEKILNKYLKNYFPAEFQKKYPALIDSHKLKNEILCTVMVNDFINTLGSTYFHQLIDDLDAKPDEIIKAYIIVKEVFDIENCWRKVEKLSSQVNIELKIALFNELQQLVERNLLWLLNQVEIKNATALIATFAKEFETLKKKLKDISSPAMVEDFVISAEPYAHSKEAYPVAQEIFALKMLTPAFDIISIAKETKSDVMVVAKKFFQIGEKLSLSWLLAQAKGFISRQYFQTVALRSLISEMFEIHKQLTINDLGNSKAKKSVLASCNGDRMNKYNSFIQDLKTGDTADAFISKLTIAVKKVRAFLSC